MLQIDNHKELALADIIPYLLQFPEIYKLAEQSGDRAQAIEDAAWQLLYNLDYTNANGVWLDYIGRKVGQDRVYTPKPTDAFTFGGEEGSKTGFGAGRFKGTKSLKSTKVARSDTNFRNAIKAKIIQNNTDTSLDELINACKLLFNASIVRIEEEYPAGIKQIDLYGSSLLELLDAVATIKSALPAGVSLQRVNLHKFYNLFKNNAFITYDRIIPESNDFEISFTLAPDTTLDKSFAIFSQNTSFASEFVSATCYFDPAYGITFMTSPSVYNDNDTGTTTYLDGDGHRYVDSDGDVILTGGDLRSGDNNNISIKRIGNLWTLSVNDKLVDQETSEHKMLVGDDVRLYLGTSEKQYYNAGSIYNLYLVDNSKKQVLINDPLKIDTIGINNGVKFI